MAVEIDLSILERAAEIKEEINNEEQLSLQLQERLNIEEGKSLEIAKRILEEQKKQNKEHEKAENALQKTVSTAKNLVTVLQNATNTISGGINALLNYPMHLNNIQNQLENLQFEHENFAAKQLIQIQEFEQRVKQAQISLSAATANAAMAEMDYRKGLLDIENGILGARKTAAEAQKAYIKELEQLYQPYIKLSDAVAEYTKNVGGSQASMKEMVKDSIEVARARGLHEKYNVSAEELVKIQTKYNQELGRSVKLTGEQQENLAALKRVYGDDKAVEFATKLSKFGYDINKASGVAGKLFSDASKHGLSVQKLSKNFLDNMKMAQTLTFRNGVKDLAKMAEKATEVNLNMQQTASAAEKMSTLEGAMEASSRLSVLGGNFSAFSNPLALLNESINDAAGLQERIISQFSDLAKWDSDKGEISMNGVDRMRMNEAAKAMGLNPSDISDMVFEKARKDQLRPEINNLGVNDDIKKLLSNVAQLDENGNGYVTINGEKTSLQDAAEMNPNELERILATQNASESENIAEIASSVMSIKDVVEGLWKAYDDSTNDYLENTGIGAKFAETTLNQIENRKSLDSQTKAMIDIGKQTADFNKEKKAFDLKYALANASRQKTILANNKIQTGLALEQAKREVYQKIPLDQARMRLQFEQAKRGDAMYDVQRLQLQQQRKMAQITMTMSTIQSVISLAQLATSGVLGAVAAVGTGAYMWSQISEVNSVLNSFKQSNDNNYNGRYRSIEEQANKAYGPAPSGSSKINDYDKYGMFARGGVINRSSYSNNVSSNTEHMNVAVGPRHIEGGIPINGGYEIEGGEAIIPVDRVNEYPSEIAAITSGTMPRGNGGFNQMAVVTKSVEPSNTQLNNGGNTEQTKNVDGNITINGTITLDLAGNTKDIDTNELLKTISDNPNFLLTLARAITSSQNQISTFAKDLEVSTFYQG